MPVMYARVCCSVVRVFTVILSIPTISVIIINLLEKLLILKEI